MKLILRRNAKVRPLPFLRERPIIGFGIFHGSSTGGAEEGPGRFPDARIVNCANRQFPYNGFFKRPIAMGEVGDRG